MNSRVANEGHDTKDHADLGRWAKSADSGKYLEACESYGSESNRILLEWGNTTASKHQGRAGHPYSQRHPPHSGCEAIPVDRMARPKEEKNQPTILCA